jgi:hypothetical protein
MAVLEQNSPAESFDKGLGKAAENLLSQLDSPEQMAKFFMQNIAKPLGESGLMAGLNFEDGLKAVQNVLDQGLKNTPELFKDSF